MANKYEFNVGTLRAAIHPKGGAVVIYPGEPAVLTCREAVHFAEQLAALAHRESALSEIPVFLERGDDNLPTQRAKDDYQRRFGEPMADHWLRPRVAKAAPVQAEPDPWEVSGDPVTDDPTALGEPDKLETTAEPDPFA